MWFGRCPKGAECGRNMALLWKYKHSKELLRDLMKQHLLAKGPNTRTHKSILEHEDP